MVAEDLSFKECAVFGEENFWRVKDIIEAQGDFQALSKIPPSFIVADLTWRCNYNCIGCVEKQSVGEKDHKWDMPVELIEDLFDYSRRHGVRGIMTMGGEVFTYPAGISKALEKSVEYQIPIKTVTNGSLLRRHFDVVSEAYKIPGSFLRVSINSGFDYYPDLTGSKVGLGKVLGNIGDLSRKEVPVNVSTVLFPRSSERLGIRSNVGDLEEIARACKDSGVKMQVLLPARDPETKRRFPYDAHEKAEVQRVSEEYGFVNSNIFERETPLVPLNQGIRYHPCPSNFLFALVGSDGKVYKCTDNRGRQDMVLGEVHKKGDFERFWHSRERVKKQFEKKCSNEGCVRQEINGLIHEACRIYGESGIRLDKYLGFAGRNREAIFI